LDFVERQSGYREMSEDFEHETLALESGKALIADVFLGDRDNED